MMPLGLGQRMVSLQGLLAIVGRPQCPKRGSWAGTSARSAPRPSRSFTGLDVVPESRRLFSLWFGVI
jgi:hypothetical protein